MVLLSTSNVYSGTGTVASDYGFGGFTGTTNSGSVQFSYATGNVISIGRWVGGFAGYSYGTISNSYYGGTTVSGAQYTGGFVGFLGVSGSSNFYSTASTITSSTNEAGLFAGYMGGSFSNAVFQSANISNIYSSYSSGSSSNYSTGISAANMKASATYSARIDNFSTNWDIIDGSFMPVIKEIRSGASVSVDNKSKTYDGAVFSDYTYSVNNTTGKTITGSLTSTGTSLTAVNAGGSYTIIGSGLGLDYTGATQAEFQKYGIVYANTGTLAIDKRIVTASASKTYDATTNLTGAVTLGNLVSGETLTYSGATVNNANVATAGKYINAITLADGTGGGLVANYELPTLDAANASVTINAKTLTLSSTKTYDGSTDMTGKVTLGNLVSGETLTYSGATANDKNVAMTGKYINSITLSDGSNGGVATNYVLPTLNAANASVTINAKAVTLSGTKVYDSTTNIASDVLTLGNLVSGEDLVLSGTGTVADKNVADGKIVTLGSLALADGTSGLAANYTFTGGTYTVDITQADIGSIGGITASNKTYDAETTATLDTTTAVTFNGILGSDVLTVATATGNFADKNVADGKTVNITGLTLGGTDVGNYNLTTATASTTANITAKELTLTGTTASNKEYDRTTDATISEYGTLGGIVTGDTVTLDSTNVTASFADWNVADGKTVAISDLVLSGTDAGNYTYIYASPVTANITKKSLGLELTGTATRVYDATTSLNFTGYTVAPTGVISGDTVVADTGSITGFIDKNVGTGKQVTFTGFTLSGADMGNYQLVSGSAVSNASITKATLSSVSGITAATKVYDATANATLTTTGATFNGILLTDVLEVATATGAFSDKNVGTAKTVNVSGITLSGTDAGNYSLTDTTATTTANITQKALAITYTGVNKTYDSTTDATVTTSDDRLGSDVLTIARTAQFDNAGGTGKNAGTNKTVNVSGVSLSGTDALNYSVIETGTTTANILKKDVTLSGLTVADKVYDGGTTATFSNAGTLIDSISGDDVAIDVAGMSAAFANKNVGTAKAITLSGVALTGTDKDNYNFTSPTGSTADITAKTLTVAYTGVNKTYDSTTDATVTTSDDRVASDVLTIGRTATFDTKNVADGKTISVSSVALSGTDALNYTVATTGTTTADIAKADIAAVTGITADNKVYDTTNTATLVTSEAAFTGMFSGDVLGVATSTGTFSDKTAADNKVVSISGITLNGTDAGNYNLTTDTASTTANISKATISAISGISADNKVYDTTTTATLTTGGATFTGLLGSDDLSVTASTALFGDKNVGNGKTVTIDSITFGGTDAGNYAISSSLSTLSADITPAAISAITGITASNKIYNQTTAATLDVSGASFTDKLGSDVLSVATSTGNFSDKNVADGKTVDITGLTLGGTDAANYTLSSNTANTTANITKKSLMLDLQGVGTKVYDGTASINLSGVTPTLTGIITGDAVTVATGSVSGFVDKNVGANKAVIYSGFALSNTDSGNYDIGSGTAASTASITRLSSVTWIGGATGNWFDAANWAGGAVPDLSNVANVIIPTGVNVSFDTSGASLGVSTSAVGIDTLGSLGSMTITDGALNVANTMTLNSLTQSGGSIATDSLSITDSFAQSGTTATVAVTNNAIINQTTGDMTLGNIQTGGTLSATAQSGNIAQVADTTLAPTGLASFNASGNIALDSNNNNFDTIALSGTDVSFKDSVGGVTLGNIATTGTFGAVSTDGNIAQASGATLSVAGVTTLDAGTNSVALSNATNDFQSTVNASGADVALADANGIELGDIATTGTLGVNAVADITQATGTALAVGGNTALASTTGDITLNSATNNFTGSFGATANTIALSNYAHPLTLGNIVSNTALSIATIGAISQATGSTLATLGTASFDAGTSDVTLSNSGNNFNELTLAGNNLSFKDSIGGVTLGDITTSGTFEAVSTGGNIAQKTGTTLALTGDASFNSGTYNTVLTNTGNDFTTLALAGNNVSFQDSVGTTTLGNVATTGAFSATNTVGGITQGVGATMAIGTDASFDVGTNNFTLSNTGNSFGSLGVTATDVAISNITGALTLANMNVAGTLGVNIASNILQKAGTSIAVTGVTTLASTAGNIALNSATNDFQSTVNASGADVALADANGIELGAITSTGTFGVSAVADITQATGTSITTGGNVALATTSGDITLGESANNFGGSFGASANSIALTNYNHPLSLGTIVSQTALNIEMNDQPITQATGATLTANGTASMDVGTANIALTNAGNDYTNITTTAGSVDEAETVDEAATRVAAEQAAAEAAAQAQAEAAAQAQAAAEEAARLASSNTLNSSSITNTLVKDIQNIEVSFGNKGNNNILNNLLQPQTVVSQREAQALAQPTQTMLMLQPIAQTFNLAPEETISIASIPTQENEMQRVSYGELLAMQAKANKQEATTEQNGEQVAGVATEYKVPVSQNSLVMLVGGGVNLPEGLEQEFYIVKDDKRFME